MEKILPEKNSSIDFQKEETNQFEENQYQQKK